MVVIKPPPDTLGARQQALNVRVNKAAASNVAFDSVRDEPETSEVDKLYKIDLAARYKNLDYAIEMLKTGDSLYTSRTLKKCQWLYEDEYSHIINPKHLQQNIFPSTSMKMKRKILKTIAASVTKPERAAEFFHYCMKEKMKNTAFTCLLYTGEDFKLNQLRNNKEQSFKTLQDKDILYFRFFVGKSFILLDALLKFISINWKIAKTARQFRFLFSESEEKYLDIAEKYISTHYGFQTDKLDPKLSDAIMKRHKHRVLANPKFYVNTIDVDVLVRNSTVDEAKIYAKALLPDTAQGFWSLHHYSIYRSVFEIIPYDQTYPFFKNYFAENYPGEEFEMHPEFYKQKYYKFMTLEQKEEWAYCQLKSEKQILGVGRDYLWYKFINFNVAFKEIKRLISVTQDAEKRNDMVEVLITSAKNDRELETLFIYYNKRHMNELRKYRDSFLRRVLREHNVFEFDENCWTAFYTLILPVDQTIKENDESESEKKNTRNYKTIALLYHILHEKDMPECFLKFLLDEFTIDFIGEHLNNIKENEKQQVLHNYFFTFYMNILTESRNQNFEYRVFNDDVEPKWRRYFDNLDKSMKTFNEDGENYEPRSNQQSKKVRRICSNEISGRSLIRDLKKDKHLAIGKLPRVQRVFEGDSININTFLKKIKIYFPEDVTTVYLKMFQEIILNDQLVIGCVHRKKRHVVNAVRSGVNAFFQLADEDVKIDFMKQYAPTGTKKDRIKLGMQHLRIQRAICRYACLSRPPVPLTAMLMFIQGENIKHCLHIFNTYLALLPLPMCQEFVRLIIDAPVSIQKHAIRLAFQCFTPDSLKEAITSIWTKTKNVSLRGVIYKAFYIKVLDTKEKQLYDVLETLTLDLNQDDEDEVLKMTVTKENKLPEEFLGNYIEAVWTAVNKFKDVEPNITRKKDVISYMCLHIQLLNEEFVSTVVNEHVNTMMCENKLQLTYSQEDIAVLYREKWVLVAQYIIFNTNIDSLPIKLKLVQYIVKKNIESWDKMAYDMYVYQKCCWDFFNDLKNISLQEKHAHFENAIPIFERMLQVIDNDLQFYDSYLLGWDLRLLITTANVINSNRKHFIKGKELEVITNTITGFGEGVGKLVTYYIECNKCFMSFSLKVNKKIKDYVEELMKLIYVGIDDKERNWREHSNIAFIKLAVALSEFELPETYLLAIQLVPSNCKECSSEVFKRLINKIQGFPNAEVQLSLYQNLQKYCERRPVA